MLTHEDMDNVRKILQDNQREPVVIDGERCFVEKVDPKWYTLLGYSSGEKGSEPCV